MVLLLHRARCLLWSFTVLDGLHQRSWGNSGHWV
jgi:hypothetical protein